MRQAVSIGPGCIRFQLQGVTCCVTCATFAAIPAASVYRRRQVLDPEADVPWASRDTAAMAVSDRQPLLRPAVNVGAHPMRGAMLKSGCSKHMSVKRPAVSGLQWP